MPSRTSQVLKTAQLKVTSAREAILDIFSSGCKPINAEYIHKRLKKTGINVVTVYRTLSSLERAGVLTRIDLRRGSVYYELSGHHHHHHIVCSECGRTESFEQCAIGSLSQMALKKSRIFKSIHGHSFELFGVCTLCSKR